MLSTFTFTVIAIIIHFGSPVDTWPVAHISSERREWHEETCIQPWASSILFTITSSVSSAMPDLNDTWIHQVNPVAYTQFHLRLVVVVVTLYVCVCLNACISFLFCMDSFFFFFFTSTATVIVVIVIAAVSHPRQFPCHLQFLHQVEFYYQMFVLYRHCVLYFFVLLLFPRLL